jgi:hypothetical protein
MSPFLPEQSVREHPTLVVAFHTNCVKWPVFLENFPDEKE